MKYAVRFAALLLCLVLCACGSDTQETVSAAKGEVFASADVLQFRQPDADALVAVFDTGEGVFAAVLYPQAAPQAVQNFVTLARQGAYDGLDFHRVLEDFIVQTGDTDGRGGQSIWGTGFAVECSDLLHHYNGALAMAGIQANHSQFFVVNCPSGSVGETVLEKMRTEGWSEEVITAYTQAGGAPYLDGVHTVFGQVFYGMDTVRALETAALQPDAVPPVLNRVSITDFAGWQTDNPNAELVFYDPSAQNTVE
jgi:peptidyl-prolyl cis-trans isomerase B (cyclophilin B)